MNGHWQAPLAALAFLALVLLAAAVIWCPLRVAAVALVTIGGTGLMVLAGWAAALRWERRHQERQHHEDQP